VDRRRSQGNFSAGLLAAAVAIFFFGLSFYAAVVYIG
jgi:hypothetical protein